MVELIDLSYGSFTSKGTEKLVNLCESFPCHVCNPFHRPSILQLLLSPLTFPNELSWNKFVGCQTACLLRWKCFSVYLELSEHFCGSLPNLIWTKLLLKHWMNNSLWDASLTSPPLFSDPVTLSLPTGALEVFSPFFGRKRRQPWDALPPGWDGFMMCCQLAKGKRGVKEC